MHEGMRRTAERNQHVVEVHKASPRAAREPADLVRVDVQRDRGGGENGDTPGSEPPAPRRKQRRGDSECNHEDK